MKKILLLLYTAVFLFSACKKTEDHVFDQSPDARINAALASYQSTLTGAPNGWKALIKPDSGKTSTYSFYFKFSNDNRVKMFSDFDAPSAVTSQESSYRLKAQQQPTLIFDTYSYVHVLADPNEAVVISSVNNFVLFSNVNGGPVGAGLLSDFEFVFDDAKIKTDTIELRGKVHNSKLILVRATKAEEDLYNSGALAAGLSIEKICTYFKRLTIGSQLYDISIDRVTRRFIFSWLDAGNLKTFSTGYYFIANGIVFTTPLVNGSQIISGFNNISWNQATETLSLTIGGTPATITGMAVPLKVDLGAPKRWWDYAVNNGNLYWASWNGFHTNCVDDGFGVQSLKVGDSTFYQLIYWPKAAPSNDFFAPLFIDVAQTGVDVFYATPPRIPTFTADGRAIFVPAGVYPSPPFLPYPTSGPAAQTRTLLYNSSGYYFVQTGPLSYDMVSALDGKSWITWIWLF